MTWAQKTADDVFCLASSQQCNPASYCGDTIDSKTACEKAAQMLGMTNATATRLHDSRGPLACFYVEQARPLSTCNGNQVQSVAQSAVHGMGFGRWSLQKALPFSVVALFPKAGPLVEFRETL